jgi:mannose-6-phosphate isomerase-like protein (cupin superfamily)
LGHINAPSSGIIVKPYLVTLRAEADIFLNLQHSGTETIYMLEGEMDYRHGDTLFRLTAGDSLQFDADTPHGAEAPKDHTVRYLSIISAPQHT